jgi:hypothetical protein
MRPRKEVLWTDFLPICRRPLHFRLHCTGTYHRSRNSSLQRQAPVNGFNSVLGTNKVPWDPEQLVQKS